MAEVDVRRGGIHAELDAERAIVLRRVAEFFQQLFFRKHLGGTGGEVGELLFGRHGGVDAEKGRC
jgi:hypothetical protein